MKKVNLIYLYFHCVFVCVCVFDLSYYKTDFRVKKASEGFFLNVKQGD